MDIQFVDYDNVRFHLSTPSSKSSIILSMGIQCWPDLLKYGAKEHLEQELGGYLTETEPEYDVSLSIDLEQIPASPGAPQLICITPSRLTGRRAHLLDFEIRPLQVDRHVVAIPRRVRGAEIAAGQLQRAGGSTTGGPAAIGGKGRAQDR
jgi:actin related protein 2/3 complex subunit 2